MIGQIPQKIFCGWLCNKAVGKEKHGRRFSENPARHDATGEAEKDGTQSVAAFGSALSEKMQRTTSR